MLPNFKIFIKKIPKYIIVLYFKTKNILILKYKKKTLVLNKSNYFFLLIIKNNLITLNYFYNLNFTLKLYFIEIEIHISKKIQLFGIGYKIFEIVNLTKKILLLKLGYSHLIYYQISEKLNFSIIKSTQLCINCSSFYNTIFNLAIIKSFKKPDVFKNKGFKFANEKLKLKFGKKV
jgi:large subunit ribosomal protein L6